MLAIHQLVPLQTERAPFPFKVGHAFWFPLYQLQLLEFSLLAFPVCMCLTATAEYKLQGPGIVFS